MVRTACPVPCMQAAHRLVDRSTVRSILLLSSPCDQIQPHAVLFPNLFSAQSSFDFNLICFTLCCTKLILMPFCSLLCPNTLIFAYVHMFSTKSQIFAEIPISMQMYTNSFIFSNIYINHHTCSQMLALFLSIFTICSPRFALQFVRRVFQMFTDRRWAFADLRSRRSQMFADVCKWFAILRNYIQQGLTNVYKFCQIFATSSQSLVDSRKIFVDFVFAIFESFADSRRCL